MSQTIAMPRSKSEYVAQRLLDRVISENMAEGTLLGTEAELLAQFDISRPTFRESLRILEAQGVLELKPGPKGGVVVSRPGTDIVAQGLSVYLKLHAVPNSSVGQARAALSTALAAEAARNGTDDDFAILEDSLQRLGGLTDPLAFGREVDRFQGLMARAGHNQVTEIFWATVTKLNSGAADVARVADTKQKRQGIITALSAVLAACRARNVVDAITRSDAFAELIRTI